MAHQTPSVGRIVHVKFRPAPGERQGAILEPAVITRVWSDYCVNVRTLGEGPQVILTSLSHGDVQALEDGRWAWPAFVPAAKPALPGADQKGALARLEDLLGPPVSTAEAVARADLRESVGLERGSSLKATFVNPAPADLLEDLLGPTHHATLEGAVAQAVKDAGPGGTVTIKLPDAEQPDAKAGPTG